MYIENKLLKDHYKKFVISNVKSFKTIGNIYRILDELSMVKHLFERTTSIYFQHLK